MKRRNAKPDNATELLTSYLARVKEKEVKYSSGNTSNKVTACGGRPHHRELWMPHKHVGAPCRRKAVSLLKGIAKIKK